MQEQEINSNIRLKIKTLYHTTNNDYEQAITQIQKEKHPILHKFI